jgi:glycosyltransferase involved in cell wall biosynthesis
LLASEVPIIGQIAGDGAKLLTESGAAIAVDPGNAEGLAEAVTAMAQMSGHERAVMAARGRDYYQNHLSAAVAAETIMNSLR